MRVAGVADLTARPVRAGAIGFAAKGGARGDKHIPFFLVPGDVLDPGARGGRRHTVCRRLISLEQDEALDVFDVTSVRISAVGWLLLGVGVAAFVLSRHSTPLALAVASGLLIASAIPVLLAEASAPDWLNWAFPLDHAALAVAGIFGFAAIARLRR